MIDAAAVLAQANLDVPIAFCPTCVQDTLPVNGVCLWCERSIATGDLVAELVAQTKIDRQRAGWRASSKRHRVNRPGTHQEPE